MLQSRTKRIVGSASGCLVVLTLVIGGFGIKAEDQNTNARKAAVPVEQLITSIRTAVAAKPGDVRAVEIENEGGKNLCEVEILAQDGKTYEVEVDVATGTVVEVESDDDDGEADDDDKN